MNAAVAVAAVVSGAMILWLARFNTFYGDEWNFLISDRGLLDPNNEHLSAGLYLVYYAILEIVGGRSYLPFMVVLVITHWTAAAGIYVLLRPRGALVATAAAMILLFLGSAEQDLYWAWQIGFVGSTAFGLWALVAIERKRYALAAGLLCGGLVMSGVGLIFLVAASVQALRDRLLMIWLMIPIAGYLTWFVGFGFGALHQIGHPFSGSTLIQLPGFVLFGMGNLLAVVSGLGVVGIPVAGAFLLLGRRKLLVWACAAGIAAEFALIGLVRIDTYAGPMWQVDRYVYPAAALLIVAVALAVESLDRPLRAIAAGLAIIALATNAMLLARGATWPRLTVETPYGCLPAQIDVTSVGWPVANGVTHLLVPAELRCQPVEEGRLSLPDGQSWLQ